MTTVTENVDLPAGVDPTQTVVTLQLAGTNGEPLDEAREDVPGGRTIAGRHVVALTSTGTWSLDLMANSALTPPGTAWRRTITGPAFNVPTTSFGEVPVSATPVVWGDILVDPPASVATSALGAHEVAERDARRLSKLVYGRRRLARLEAQQVNGGATQTLANLSGAGTVTSIWMALGFNATPHSLVLRVTVDGEATPAFETDLGSLLALHWGPGDGEFASDHVHVEQRVDSATGFTFAIPMPFRTGILIELVNPTGGLVIAYAEVAWTDRELIPYRLRGSARTMANAVTLAQGDTHTYLDVLGSGWLVWHGLSESGATSGGFIERNHEVSIDGEASPSWVSTGTEDWFLGSFTFQARQRFGKPFGLVGANTTGPDRISVALDLLAAHGGIRFETRLVFRLGTEAGVNTASTFSYVALYYLAA